MYRRIPVTCLALLALGVPAAADDTDPEPPGRVVTTKEGLTYRDAKPGTGVAAKAGDVVQVRYTGWLGVKGKKGKVVDSNEKGGGPFTFTIGQGQVILGWEIGIAGMKAGGKRLLLIPAKLAYGERGAGAIIPPNSDLIFQVEVVKIGK